MNTENNSFGKLARTLDQATFGMVAEVLSVAVRDGLIDEKTARTILVNGYEYATTSNAELGDVDLRPVVDELVAARFDQ